PVAAGDYATGGNHVLPTGGRARSTGGLGLEAFLKPVTVQRLTRDGLERVRPVVEALAQAEGMTAHAEAVQPPDWRQGRGAARGERPPRRRSGRRGRVGGGR